MYNPYPHFSTRTQEARPYKLLFHLNQCIKLHPPSDSLNLHKKCELYTGVHGKVISVFSTNNEEEEIHILIFCVFYNANMLKVKEKCVFIF